MLSEFVEDLYDRSPDYRRLQDLDERIRVLQRDATFKHLLEELSRGRRLQSDPELLNALRIFGVDFEIERLMENYTRIFEERALQPPVREAFYAEWDQETSTLQIILPFQSDGGPAGLSLLYYRTNPILSRKVSLHSRYETAEIADVYNLLLAHNKLDSLVGPREFGILNIKLQPSLMGNYTVKYADNLQLDGVNPLVSHPIKRERYIIIGQSVVELYSRNHSEGVPPRAVKQYLDEKGIVIPISKLQGYLQEMAKLGLLQRNHAISGPTVLYYPLNTRVSEELPQAIIESMTSRLNHM